MYRESLHNCIISLSVSVGICSLAMISFDASAQRRGVQARVSHLVDSAPAKIEVYDYDYVDVRPQFPGGDAAMLHYINSARRYPAGAYERRVEGRVMCGFIVNADGSISNIRVVKGVEDALNREAVRIISEMPRWQAGRQGSEAVPVYCLLPIAFRL